MHQLYCIQLFVKQLIGFLCKVSILGLYSNQFQLSFNWIELFCKIEITLRKQITFNTQAQTHSNTNTVMMENIQQICEHTPI